MKAKFILIIIFSISYFFAQAQQSVYLESSKKGRGILKSRGNECFVITPAHVVKESIKDISITGEKNVLSKGRLVQTLAPDLAIVRVTGGGTQNCVSWSVPENYFTILDNSIEGYLELVQNNGSKKRTQVFISETDEDIIIIEPKRINQPFIKGMSGASLFTHYNDEKVFLGMLQEIDEDGNGFVFQVDDMERILGGFFVEDKIRTSDLRPDINNNQSKLTLEKNENNYTELTGRWTLNVQAISALTPERAKVKDTRKTEIGIEIKQKGDKLSGNYMWTTNNTCNSAYFNLDITGELFEGIITNTGKCCGGLKVKFFGQISGDALYGKLEPINIPPEGCWAWWADVVGKR